MDERSIRWQLLQSFLTCPHGKLDAYEPLHREAMERDPVLYGHLARWYADRGTVRDHQQLFIAHLLASPFPEHREHGHVLMERLRVYQVARVVRRWKEHMHRGGRSLRSAVTSYLRRREAHVAWWDECVIRNRRDLKYLYASLHIRPGPRAEAVLFNEDVPSDSRIAAARQLSKLGDEPDRQAELILRHRIHFTTALGTLRHYTPSVTYALVSVMTPPQVVNNLKFLEKRGALTHPQTRALIDERLSNAVGHARVNDMKMSVALRQVQADAKLAENLLRVTHERLRNRGRIDVPTALIVDKSGSMEQCIAIGKLLACVCSTLADSALHVTAFDDAAFTIQATEPTFAAWEKAFSRIRADGCTSIGAGLRPLLDHALDQVLLISDGEENTAPYFSGVLADYERRHCKSLRVIWVKVGGAGTTSFETSMAGREMTVIPFDGDYYSLPNIVPMLASGTRYDLLEEVLATPIHTRADLATLPPGFDEATLEIL